MNEIAKAFSDYFKSFNLELPDDALREKKAGKISGNGWNVSYVFGSDEQGTYLDFYASHRMTNGRHCRIRENGELEGLPCYREFYGLPKDATEEEKKKAEEEYLEYNRKIGEKLRRKGLID